MQNKTFEILELLVKTPGRYDKEDILKANADNEELKFLFETSFNPYLIYGVKDFKLTPDDFGTASFNEIKLLRSYLINGEIRGNAAKEELEKLLATSNPLACKWLEAAFKKNIKCGVDVKTINKIWPKLIPVFEVGLCAVFNGDKLPEGLWYVEPKMDGLRGICFIDSMGEIEFLSRTGKPIYNLEHIKEEIKQFGLKNVVLDGEIMGRDWNESVGIARSEKNTKDKDTKQLKYYVFDMVDLRDWRAKETKNWEFRKSSLYNIFVEKKFSYLIHVPSNVVLDLEQAKIYYDKYLLQGFEGVVLKRYATPYPFKRSKDWLKWKPFDTLDLVVIGYEEGKNKNKGRLGKLFVDYKGVKVGVGGGYKEKEPNNERRIFWEIRDQMVEDEEIIEIKHYGVTQDGSLKTAQFLRRRLDKR